MISMFRYAFQWLRSLLFVTQMYVMMAVIGIGMIPWVYWHPDGAFHVVRLYCKYIRWTARWMIGLDSQVRGPVPTGEVLVAAKHQSFFDVILLVSVLPRPKFIMKDSIRYMPILGFYGRKVHCVAVKRGQRATAIRKMVEGVMSGKTRAGQLIIYPQGTRVGAGDKHPYKVGTAALYEAMGSECVLAATNVGVFWPRMGVYRKPGLAVAEFLTPPVSHGLDRDSFMREIEDRIEGASDALMDEGRDSIPAAFR